MNLEHSKNMGTENVMKVLYLHLLKDLYSCIESAILWYDLYVKILKSHGFVVNTYDRCIKNFIIDNNQCTIAWYVGDNKVSHIDKYKNTRII